MKKQLAVLSLAAAFIFAFTSAYAQPALSRFLQFPQGKQEEANKQMQKAVMVIDKTWADKEPSSMQAFVAKDSKFPLSIFLGNSFTKYIVEFPKGSLTSLDKNFKATARLEYAENSYAVEIKVEDDTIAIYSKPTPQPEPTKEDQYGAGYVPSYARVDIYLNDYNGIVSANFKAGTQAEPYQANKIGEMARLSPEGFKAVTGKTVKNPNPNITLGQKINLLDLGGEKATFTFEAPKGKKIDVKNAWVRYIADDPLWDARTIVYKYSYSYSIDKVSDTKINITVTPVEHKTEDTLDKAEFSLSVDSAGTLSIHTRSNAQGHQNGDLGKGAHSDIGKLY